MRLGMSSASLDPAISSVPSPCNSDCHRNSGKLRVAVAGGCLLSGRCCEFFDNYMGDKARSAAYKTARERLLTPAMIEAGVQEWARWSHSDADVEALVTCIFLAMAGVREGSLDQKDY
jgi:hypothetical protein